MDQIGSKVAPAVRQPLIVKLLGQLGDADGFDATPAKIAIDDRLNLSGFCRHDPKLFFVLLSTNFGGVCLVAKRGRGPVPEIF